MKKVDFFSRFLCLIAKPPEFRYLQVSYYKSPKFAHFRKNYRGKTSLIFTFEMLFKKLTENCFFLKSFLFQCEILLIRKLTKTELCK